VENIDFAGNESFSAWTLKQVIKLRHRRWLFWPTYYTEDAVKEDVNRLRDFYYGQGYLDHKVTAQTEFNDDRSRVDVIFIIEEGPLYYVGDIVFTGQTKYTAEQLQAKTKLRVGDVYKKPRAEKDAKDISQIYREQGYVDAEVRQEPHFTPEKQENTVAVTFTVREGRQFRLGQIDVTGNEQTRDKAVRRILDEYGFTPGQLYNAKIAPKEGGGLLEKYVGRGVVTEQATIRPVTPPPGSDPNIRDARVDIKEGMTGRIQPGVGFSSDAGFIGQLIYEQRNFDITDAPKSVDEIFLPWKAWRGGGEVFSVRLEPGTRYSAYTVDYVNPYFNDQPVTFDTEGRWWKWFRESYDETRLKGAFGFEQRLPDDWRRSIGFRAENVGINNLAFDAPQEIRDVKGHSQLFGVRFGIGKSVVDDIYDPTRGWRANLSYEQVTGDYTFGLLEGNLARYTTLHEDVLGRRTVLVNSLLAATTVGDAPPFEKFYGGGSSHYGIRGFEYRGVSPRGLSVIHGVTTDIRKYPIGSDWIFLAKSELIIPLVGHNFNGLIFVDSGTVETGSYRASAGVGIEIKLPQSLGNIPMRFELGFPFLKASGDKTQVFSFAGGGLMGF
jgi:outer membrane protein insertion porin family